MTNLELMTTSAARLAELGRPCLPLLDALIVNDFEIGALSGRETRRADGSTDPTAVRRAIDEALALGAMRWVVAHFPEGAVVGGRDGSRLALGSVAIPISAVAGANGAGDAFAAGMIYGLHEDWPIADSSAARPRLRRRLDARGLDHRGGSLGRRMSGARGKMGLAAARRLTHGRTRGRGYFSRKAATRSFRLTG